MVIQDRYQMGELLGEGAFARTVAATDLRTGGAVVVKMIALRGLPGWKPYESFEHEVAVLRSLEHPGVPRFVDAFETVLDEGGPSLALVMERIPGDSLLSFIERRHRWPEDQARTMLRSLLETLDYLQRLSPPVIHRDIKPSNVVVRPDGRPVLVDFGAVHQSGLRSGHGSLTVLGTVGYMAPEQGMGAPVPASDLYALGATVIHVLSHCHPADLPRRGLRLDFRRHLGCSEQVISVLERLVEPALEDRYSRAADALEDLRRPTVLAPRPRTLEPKGPATLTRSPERPALARIPLPVAPRELTAAAEQQVQQRTQVRDLSTMAIGGSVAATSGILVLAMGLPVVLLAGVSAVVGGLAVLHRRKSKQRDQELWRDGVALQGRVSDVHREEGLTFPHRERVTIAHVSYDVQLNDQWVRGTLEARGEAAERVREGDPVVVVHDPSDPFQRIAVLAS